MVETAIAEDVVLVKLNQILSAKLGLEVEQITDTASFSDDFGIDSLDMMEVFMEVEKAFNIKIEDEEAVKLTNVKLLIIFIKNKST